MTMALDPTLRELDECGCCTGLGPSTPGVVLNRPGLSAIAYRSATWHEFKQSLIASLAASQHPELAALTMRADDDFTIALLDSVAVVGDVLTFYQERIANESYLRTATERFSVLELARLIGYELKPGVAASTSVAFTLEDTPGAPRVATIDVGVKVQSVPGQDEKPQTFETVERIDARAELNAMKPRLTAPQTLTMSSSGAWFAGTANNLKVGDAVLLMDANRSASATDDAWDMRRVSRVLLDSDNDRTFVEWDAAIASHLPASPATVSVFALRTRASLFGYNAIDPKLLATDPFNKFNAAGRLDTSDGNRPVWKYGFTGKVIPLDAPYAGIRQGSWVVLVNPSGGELYHVDVATEAAKSDYALSGRTTDVTLSTDTNLTAKFSGAKYAATVVFGESDRLLLDEAPVPPVIRAGNSSIIVDVDAGDIDHGRRVMITGKTLGGVDVADTLEIDHVEDITGVRAGKSYRVSRLVFTTALQHTYRLDTVTVYGNVALATQGETVNEVLGGGDASKPYQRFVLKQPPVTFVRDNASPSGAASTLSVRVNDLLWQEVSSFYGRDATERIYTTRRDDDGRTVVQFGDGIHGARLPTGQENVRATYRKGAGVGGNVKRGQLSTLLTRPLGTKEAINPIAATGGDDAESRDGARDNAPLTVLTLDRVVSLRDYEDFSRAYAGIGKALATWTWDGERRGVFVTVAGPDGARVADDVRALLIDALRTYGDAFVPLRVESYRAARFTTAFKLRIDPVFERAKVQAAVVDALRTRFAFEARAFGQSVALSEVIATIQAVAGVAAVDLDSLVRTDGVGGSGLLEPLPAALPQAESLAGTQAAELLTLATAPIVPGDMP